MPFYDLDEENTIFEPLKIKVGGIELVIDDVGKKEFDEIAELDDPYAQVAKLAKVPIKKIEHIKMKRIATALKIINREFLGPAVGHFQPKKV